MGTPQPARVLQYGDIVNLTCDGRTVEAKVVLASPNGQSLALEFEGIVNWHIGVMAVSQRDGGGYIATVTGAPVQLEFVCSGIDPDNLPLTPTDFARMKPKSPRRP